MCYSIPITYVTGTTAILTDVASNCSDAYAKLSFRQRVARALLVRKRRKRAGPRHFRRIRPLSRDTTQSEPCERPAKLLGSWLLERLAVLAFAIAYAVFIVAEFVVLGALGEYLFGWRSR